MEVPWVALRAPWVQMQGDPTQAILEHRRGRVDTWFGSTQDLSMSNPGLLGLRLFILATLRAGWRSWRG